MKTHAVRSSHHLIGPRRSKTVNSLANLAFYTESIEWLKEGQGSCGHVIRLHAHPLPPLSPRYTRLATHRKTEKERQLADVRGGEGGGHGAESYDRKRLWPSINHSILSEFLHNTIYKPAYKCSLSKLKSEHRRSHCPIFLVLFEAFKKTIFTVCAWLTFDFSFLTVMKKR